MNFQFRLLFMLTVGCMFVAPKLSAQDPTRLAGRITSSAGQPLLGAFIIIPSMNIGVASNSDGRYALIVPASRATGQTVEMSVSMIGRATEAVQVTLRPGTQEFDFSLGEDPLLLDEIVVIGQGLEIQRQKLGVTINTVRAEEIALSHEPNIVAALAGKAPNVEVTSSGGDPGAGSYIRIRGANSLIGSNQPLFVVDGQPITNSSDTIGVTLAGVVVGNRAMDLNPADIESIHILKGAAAAAIYGSRAGNGVILITTKRGQPGTNRVEFRSSLSIDQVNRTIPLQRAFGQGVDGAAIGLPGMDLCGGGCAFTWGESIGSGTPVFDHSNELYKTAFRNELGLTWSGGTATTDYYLSLGRLSQDGVIKGNQAYNRTTVRLRAGHAFRNDLRVSANFSFADSRGDYLQQGSNRSGVQLGALRTPPDFNNQPYLTAEGLHRSYQLPDPTTVTESRKFDNPFWISNEITSTAKVARTFGNINARYTPFNWLKVSYMLGSDYTADERKEVFPKSSSDFPEGRIVRADFVTLEVDSNLLATATRPLSDFAFGTLTIGQNLNHREFRQYRVNGSTLIESADQLDFTVGQIPNEFTSTVRTDGYFAQGTVDLWDQLYLTAAARLDGSNTFGGEDKRYVYPKASAAWDLSSRVEDTPLSFAKLRVAFGIAGKQPDLFSNVSAFTTGIFTDSWLNPNGLLSIYGGREGVFTETILGNNEIKPERTTEYEAGADVAFLDNRLSLGVTYYYQRTKDAILAVDVAPSTGFYSKFANAAEFENRGWELTAAASMYESPDLSWDIAAFWAKNESCALDLAGTEEFRLNRFVAIANSVVAPERDANGDITLCHPIGVFFGFDFVRFGNGSLDTDTNVDIDANFSGWNAGDVYIPSDGYPQQDPQSRVIGDPNPDWTASIRNTVRIGDDLRISALLDFKYGGQMWNGTRGALAFYGTHSDLEPYQGEGQNETFGETFLQQYDVAGPGAGTSVPINWSTWFLDGIGSHFFGPASQFIEDGGYIKLRDISVAYTIRGQDWLTRMGFTTLDVSVSGRNLKTWTDYTGIDPESNLNGQTLGRGLEYFNNPQTRSFALNFTLAR